LRVQPTLLGDVKDPLNHSRWLEYISRSINGQISFGDTISNPNAQGQNTDVNLSVWKFEGTTGVAANTPFLLQHSLVGADGKPRKPVCIVGQVTKDGGVIYGDWTTWTTTTITLKSTTANTPFRLIIA
jgi:hypothetical protein